MRTSVVRKRSSLRVKRPQRHLDPELSLGPRVIRGVWLSSGWTTQSLPSSVHFPLAGPVWDTFHIPSRVNLAISVPLQMTTAAAVGVDYFRAT